MPSGIKLTGLVSGLDTDSLVTQLMALDRRPLDALKKKQNALTTERDAWKDINMRIAGLQTKASSVASKTAFYGKAVTSTDESVTRASATSAAGSGVYDLNITQTARAHVVASAPQLSPTTTLALAGSPVINGQTVTVASGDSLDSIRDRINATAGINVVASVVKVNATDYKLILTSSNTGTANLMTMTDNGGVLSGLGLMVTGAPNTIQDAQDAMLSINGIVLVKPGNQLDDVAQGVSFTIRRPGTATIEVKPDFESVVTAVREFVSQFNSTVDFIAQKMAYNSETKVAGPLLGDSALALLASELRRLTTGAVPGLPATMNNLQQVGVTTGVWGSLTGKDGKLTLDETKLRDAAKTDLDGVARLFGALDNNVALASKGGTATASSEFDPIYAASGVINGDTSSDRWGSEGGGWQDGTLSTFPDHVDIDFGSAKTISRIDVHTLNSTTYPASTYGVKDLTLRYWDGAQWNYLASTTGNLAGLMTHTFSPVSATKIRLEVATANGANDYARVTEVQVFEKNYGVARRLSDTLNAYTRAGGVLPERKDSLEKQIKRVGSQILKMEDRLAERETRLRRELLGLEKVLSSLQSQSSWLNSQLSQWYGTSSTR